MSGQPNLRDRCTHSQRAAGSRQRWARGQPVEEVVVSEESSKHGRVALNTLGATRGGELVRGKDEYAT